MQGTRLANLRRRSRSCVYLGHLTPALPAGRGLSLVGGPAGRWCRAGDSRSSTRAAAGAAAAREPRGPGGAAGQGGLGAVPRPLVAPARRSPRPRPGAPPPQPLRARPPAPGGARGGDEGNLKSLRSLPPAPPAQAPPLVPGPVKSPTEIPRLHREFAEVPPIPESPSESPLCPLPRSRTQKQSSGSGYGGPEKEPFPSSHLPPPPAARSPGRCGAPAGQPPRSGLAD